MARPTGLRVLVVSHATALWGAERVLVELGKRLAARGFECVLACPPDSPLRATWTGTSYPLPSLAGRGLRRPDGTRLGPVALARQAWSLPGPASRIVRLARNVDLIWSNSQTAHLDVGLAARAARRAAVLYLHDIVRPGLGRHVLTGAVRLAGAAIAPSAAVADTVHRHTRGRVEIVPNGVDTASFTPGPPDPAFLATLGIASPSARLVGVIGRIDPEKRIETVIGALARLPRPLNAHLVVVGSPFLAPPSYLAALQTRAARLLADRAHFVPRRADVSRVIRSLDVVVSASRNEPFGLSLLEAQASGVPVVATRAGGVPEFVEHGETGLLVPPEDEAALAAAIERILTDDNLRRLLTTRALDRVRSDFTLDCQADRVAEIFRRLVEARGRRPTPAASPLM